MMTSTPAPEPLHGVVCQHCISILPDGCLHGRQWLIIQSVGHPAHSGVHNARRHLQSSKGCVNGVANQWAAAAGAGISTLRPGISQAVSCPRIA